MAPRRAAFQSAWRRILCGATLLVAVPLGAQDSTFLLVARDPSYRHPAVLGNGRFSMLTSPTGLAATPSFLAGLYERAPGDVPRIAGLPAWSEVDFHDGRSRLGAAAPVDSVLRDYRQTVDMRDGVVRTSYEWVNGDRRTTVRVVSFVSRRDSTLAAVRLVLVPHFAGRVRASFTLRTWPAPRRLELARLERVDPAWGNEPLWYPGHMTAVDADAETSGTAGRIWMTSRTAGRPTMVAQAAAIVVPADLPGAVARPIVSDTLVELDVEFDARPGATYTFDKLVSVATSDEGADPLARALRDAERARATGFDALLRAHVEAWNALWATDIQVDGDPELQRVVRAMLFWLLGSARAGASWSIPPMGLSGAGYYGHVFWDADTWMFPALLLAHADVARSMVAFRSRTLDAARRNARANGFRGAMYPWEADERGEETTPRFAAQNARYELHVTGDVALAQWQYFVATADTAWLARQGEPVLRATADFWVSRATCAPTRRRCDIRDVVSVDEGLRGVTNDAYTNAIARRNLQVAGLAARTLGRRANPRWAQVADALHVPFDSAGHHHRTYEGAPDSTLGSVVPLLAYPLGLPMSERAKRTDLAHAIRRLEQEGPGAMMTTTLYPVVAAELGDRALVDSLLPGTYRGWLREPFLVLSETPRTDAVNFVTGAGGFLQQVIYGYTGLRIRDEGVVPAFDPLLPSRIDRLVLRNFRIRGECWDVVVERQEGRVVRRMTRGGKGPACRE